MTDSDRELVERFLAHRDAASFEALYDRHTGVMYRCALRSLRAVPAAEDAVQDAWLRAVHGLDGFRWSSALRSWLVGITLNCCRERLRRSRVVEPPLAPFDVQRAPPRPDAAVDLERALERLPARASEVLILHDVEGFTHQEVAEALDIAPGTSKSQLSRARRLLRRALA